MKEIFNHIMFERITEEYSDTNIIFVQFTEMKIFMFEKCILVFQKNKIIKINRNKIWTPDAVTFWKSFVSKWIIEIQ